MTNKLSVLLFALPLVALTAGCADMAPPAQVPRSEPPKILTRSLYSKDQNGSLGEDDLQRVLGSPIDLQFPARVGVVPLTKPFEPRGQVSIATRSAASRDLATALFGDPHFSHVSDISTELPNAGGIEGLRVIAARYRMRYLLLYSERFEDSTHLNDLAWLYPTVLGMFLAPGVTVESHGIAQADLLDVRTGTLLFSVIEPMHVSSRQLLTSSERAHRRKQAEAAAEAAKRLARRVIGQTNQLIAYADEMAKPASPGRPKTRVLPAPVADTSSGAGEPVTMGNAVAR
jgi:hypothetical protein